MSLAFAIFGPPHYPTVEAHHTYPHGSMESTMDRPTPFDDSWDEPLAQYNIDLSAHGKHDSQGIRSADTHKWRVKKAAIFSDGPPHKRQRPATTISPTLLAPSSLHEYQQAPLLLTQPASPPPAHMLRAGMYANTSLALIPVLADLECPIRADNILRWVGYALRYGFHALGIDVVDGWAHLHQLAKAAISDRKDLEGLIPGALRRVIEQDTTGRWMIVGGRVCKVPRHARRAAPLVNSMDEHQDIRPRLRDVPASVSPPTTKTLEMSVVACHCALSECVYHYSLLEKSLCQATAPQ